MSADVLSEILQFVPPVQRRYLGRSLSRRYHQETEMLAAELVQSKPVTNEELAAYCEACTPANLTLKATSLRTQQGLSWVNTDYYFLRVKDKRVIGFAEYSLERSLQTKSFALQSMRSSGFEGESTTDLITQTIATFEGYYYEKEGCNNNDYQPIPEVTPDLNALTWIYTRRLQELEISSEYLSVLIPESGHPEGVLELAVYLMSVGELDPLSWYINLNRFYDNQDLQKLQKELLTLF